MLEIAVVSAEQRADVTPMERAEGYGRLIDEHGASIDEIAAKVGKSSSAIRAILKLRNLPAIAREAVDAGLIPPSTAELIARVPNAATREEVARRILVGGNRFTSKGATEKQARKAMADNEEPLTFRDAKEMVGHDYLVELKQAPFDRQSLDLVPAAGSCDECSFRVGNLQQSDPDAYAGVRADVCTDPECYRSKVEAHGKRLVQEAKATGKKVLPKSETKEMFAYGGSRLHSSQYVDLAEDCYEAQSSGTWGKFVGEQLADEVVLAVDPSGGVHRLAPRSKALAVVRKESKQHRQRPSDGEAKWKARQAKDRALQKARREIAQRSMGLVAEAAELKAGALLGWSPEVLSAFRQIAAGIVDRAWDEVNRQVRDRRGLGKDRRGSGNNRDPVVQLVGTLSGPQLVGLLAEIVAGQYSLGWTGNKKDEAAFWSTFGVNAKKGEKTKGEAAKVIDQVADEEQDPVVKKRLKRMVKDLAGEPASGQCSVCNCTEQNCQRCVERMGRPCSWTSDEETLCTACLPLVEADIGILFVGRDRIPAELLGQVEAAGVRTIGHALRLSDDSPINDLDPDLALKLQERAVAWVETELVAGQSAELEEVTRETRLFALTAEADEGVRHALVRLDAIGVATVGDLLDRVAKQDGKTFDDRLYAAVRSTLGVQAQQAKEACKMLGATLKMADKPAEVICQRCGRQGELCDAAAADQSADLVTCIGANVEDALLRALGVPDGEHATHYLCIACVGVLNRETAKGNRRRKVASA
jgi:hypothetical protein